MNNLGRGPLDEATYQISKALAFNFQTRFLKFSLYAVIFLGVCPASYTHNFTRGRKKLLGESMGLIKKILNVRTFCI